MPVCSRCDDTHVMDLRGQTMMCTRCPTPCSDCRDGLRPYCATTPCSCSCHDKPWPRHYLCYACDLKNTRATMRIYSGDHRFGHSGGGWAVCDNHAQPTIERLLAKMLRDQLVNRWHWRVEACRVITDSEGWPTVGATVFVARARIFKICTVHGVQREGCPSGCLAPRIPVTRENE